MFLTAKKVQTQIADAVADERRAQEGYLARIEDEHGKALAALREEMARLRADHAERETEMEREVEQRILAERQYHHAAVTGLMASVAKVQDHVKTLAREDDVKSWVDRLHTVVAGVAGKQMQEARETTDVVQYLLDAPVPVKETVIREVETGKEMPDLTPMIADLHGKIGELQRAQAVEVARLQDAIEAKATADVEVFAKSVAALNRQVAGLEAQIVAVQQPRVVVQGPGGGWVRRMG